MGKELFVPWFAYLGKISLFLLSIVGLSWLSLILLFTSRKRQSREEYLGDKPHPFLPLPPPPPPNSRLDAKNVKMFGLPILSQIG